MDKQLGRRAQRQVVFHPCVGLDGYGDPQFGAPVTLDVYRHGKITKVISLEGTEEVSSVQLITDGIIPVTEKSYVVSDGVEMRIKAFENFDGLHRGQGTTVLYL